MRRCISGCSAIWASWYREDIACKSCCSSHWLYLHTSFWFWACTEIYWRRFTDGQGTLCYGKVFFFLGTIIVIVFLKSGTDGFSFTSLVVSIIIYCSSKIFWRLNQSSAFSWHLLHNFTDDMQTCSIISWRSYRDSMSRFMQLNITSLEC